jgi:hypothetical protein
VILGICFLFAAITLLICPCFYCCRACGNCGGKDPRPAGYSRNEKRAALIVLIIGFLFLMCVPGAGRGIFLGATSLMLAGAVRFRTGCVIGLFCNESVSQGITYMVVVATSTLGQALDLLRSAPDVVDAIILDLNTTVSSIKAQVVAAPLTIVKPTLLNLVNGVITPVNGIQATVNNMTTTVQGVVRGVRACAWCMKPEWYVVRGWRCSPTKAAPCSTCSTPSLGM